MTRWVSNLAQRACCLVPVRLGDGLCKVEVLTQIESIRHLAQDSSSCAICCLSHLPKELPRFEDSHMSGAWSRTTAPSLLNKMDPPPKCKRIPSQQARSAVNWPFHRHQPMVKAMAKPCRHQSFFIVFVQCGCGVARCGKETVASQTIVFRLPWISTKINRGGQWRVEQKYRLEFAQNSQKSPASCAATSPRVKNPRVAGGLGEPRVTPDSLGQCTEEHCHQIWKLHD